MKDLTTGKDKAILKELRNPWSVAFSPDGKTLAVLGASSKLVRQWDVAANRELVALPGHTAYVWTVAFSPDSKTMASASNEGTIRLWDGETGKERATISNST